MKPKSYTGVFMVEKPLQGKDRYLAQFDFQEGNRNLHLRFVSDTIEGLVEDMHEDLNHATRQLSLGQKTITIESLEGKMRVHGISSAYTLRPLDAYETRQLLSELKKAGVKTRKR